MYRRFSVNFTLFSIALDALCVVIALKIATYLRPALGFLPFAAEYPQIVTTPSLVYIISAALWISVLSLFSVYDGRRNIRGINEFTNLSLGSLLATVAMAGMLYLSYRQVSRLLFIAFVITGLCLMLVWRVLVRLWLQQKMRQPEQQRKVIVIGAGKVGKELQQQIQAIPQLGLRFSGFLDDDFWKQSNNSNILGSLSNVVEVVSNQQIDDVVIALPQHAYTQLDRLIGELHCLPVKVWVIPDYFRLALHKATIDEFAGIPMLDLRAPAISDNQRLAKRAFDLLVTLILFPLALPIMAFTALLVSTEGRQGILLYQPRAGENGRIFKMLKFRTMINGTEEKPDYETENEQQEWREHKTINDPRVTRIGRILRRTSLDELPQLFNVLWGQMSLVGPRPELPWLVERYEPWQRQRFAVPQGITGWWQIHGRSDRPMHLYTEDDLYYVQNYSLLLDIIILIRTIGVVIQGKGAF